MTNKKDSLKGSFLKEIKTALTTNSDMTIGEILYSFTRQQELDGKHYFYASDDNIFSAIQRFNSYAEEEDTILNDFEFENWQKSVIKK